MQQRQLRLGDILDDYCPRERRLTNHAVVAMIGEDVRLTRCTTCEAEHDYKHAKVPRPRKKTDEGVGTHPAMPVGAPKRIGADAPVEELSGDPEPSIAGVPDEGAPMAAGSADAGAIEDDSPAGDEEPSETDEGNAIEDGPVHRTLIRATLPRHEGQVPQSRPAPDFTIRQPAGNRPVNRFRGRPQGGGQMFQGNRSGGPSGSMGNGPGRGPSSRPQGGRSSHDSMTSRPPRRHEQGRKRSK